MNAIELLKHQHREVEALFKQMHKAQGGRAAAEAVREDRRRAGGPRDHRGEAVLSGGEGEDDGGDPARVAGGAPGNQARHRGSAAARRRATRRSRPRARCWRTRSRTTSRRRRRRCSRGSSGCSTTRRWSRWARRWKHTQAELLQAGNPRAGRPGRDGARRDDLTAAPRARGRPRGSAVRRSRRRRRRRRPRSAGSARPRGSARRPRTASASPAPTGAAREAARIGRGDQHSLDSLALRRGRPDRPRRCPASSCPR